MSYEDNALSVSAMLKRKGQTITLHRNTVGEYDPLNSSTTITSVDVSRFGALFNYENKDIDGTLVQKGDVELYMEAGVVPTDDDEVTVSGIRYSVELVDEINPAGIPVLYILQLRR